MNIRHFVLAVCATLMARPAIAGERDASLAGSALDIEASCAARISIAGGSASGITVRATADHPEELAALAFGRRGPTATIGHLPRDASCWRPPGANGFTPTLALLITVPPATPIALSDGGALAYAIDAVRGPLRLRLGGATTGRVDSASALEADLAGADRLTVGAVDGPVRLRLSGASDVSVGEIDTPRLSIASAGSGDVEVVRGRIGTLDVTADGGATMRVGAVVGDATVSIAGSATVRLARVTGRLDRRVVGSGGVSVGE